MFCYCITIIFLSNFILRIFITDWTHKLVNFYATDLFWLVSRICWLTGYKVMKEKKYIYKVAKKILVLRQPYIRQTFQPPFYTICKPLLKALLLIEFPYISIYNVILFPVWCSIVHAFVFLVQSSHYNNGSIAILDYYFF